MRAVTEPSRLADRYQLVSLLHRDSDVAVYEALDEHAGERPVVVKVLHADRALDPETRQAFKQAADRARQVTDPGIVPLVDYDLDAPQPYIVEAKCRGRSLQQRLDAGFADWNEAIKILESAADAMAAVHRAGLTHGGLNALNICVDENDKVTIADLGRPAPKPVTHDEILHLAPEQLHGAGSTPRCDVYSLASLGFTLLCGEPPYDSDDPEALRRMKSTTAPPQLVELRPDLPDEVVTTIDAALARDPAFRPGSAAAFADALRHGLPVARPTVVETSPWPLMIATITAALLLGLVGWLLLTAGVPNVVGLPEFEARRVLDDAGLDAQVAAYNGATAVTPGSVVSQAPQPGRRVARGFDVALTIASAATIRAPSLMGMTEQQARAVLADNGLRLGRLEVAAVPTQPAGLVIAQAPHPGEAMVNGGFVSLVLSGATAQVITIPVLPEGDTSVIPVPEIDINVELTPPADSQPPPVTIIRPPVATEPPAEPLPPTEPGQPVPPPPGGSRPEPIPPTEPSPPSGPSEPLQPGTFGGTPNPPVGE